MLLETNTEVVDCYLGVFKTVITIETGDITLEILSTAPRHEETNVESCDGEEMVGVTDMGTVAAATPATVTAPTATTVPATTPTVTATIATRPPNTRETSRA
tara:strand:+ start:2606 stop:2911 length:306 start_codon:yes stop_codon:yes gene_type:complete